MRASYIVPAAHVKNVCNLLLISDWDSWEGHWLTGRQSQHEDESIPWTKNHHPLWPIFSTARCKDYAKKCPKHVERELYIPRESLDEIGILHYKAVWEQKMRTRYIFRIFDGVFKCNQNCRNQQQFLNWATCGQWKCNCMVSGVKFELQYSLVRWFRLILLCNRNCYKHEGVNHKWWYSNIYSMKLPSQLLLIFPSVNIHYCNLLRIHVCVLGNNNPNVNFSKL